MADHAGHLLALFALAAAASACPGTLESAENCTVVVSQATAGLPEWAAVVDALMAKHGGAMATEVVTYSDSVDECRAALADRMPKYTCFVARPEEAGREYVADVHQLTRRLDDDPYTDTLWGILTGYDGDAALRTARHAAPLTVRRVAAGTEIALESAEEGVWYCELVKNKMVRKRPGGQAEQAIAPDDTTEALVETLNTFQADLFVTSGHATERDWQIGFRYKNGSFRCRDGRLFGRDSSGREYPIDSPNPKVYLPVGNCLMGHIDSTDAMALAWMNSAGVVQMIGYTVPTWFGYAGWGCLDYFVEQPGRYTFCEAFFANHHALIHRLETEYTAADGAIRTSGEGRGLLFDRDAVAFYGDPAWQARMAPADLAWEQSLTVDGDTYRFDIKPLRGEATFRPVNTNGSQRGWRPIVAYLPHRVRHVEVVEGAELAPRITDDFILVPNPRQCDPQGTYRVVFRARPFEPAGN